jgi:hypothetical protein
MVIVHPFVEVVCEIIGAGIGGGVFEIDDDELTVSIVGIGKLCLIFDAEDIAILSLVLTIRIEEREYIVMTEYHLFFEFFGRI